MASENPINDNNAHNKSVLASDETAQETRRIMAQRKGTVNELIVGIFDSSGNQVDTFGGSGGGDATAANQTTMIGHLATIAGDTTSIDDKTPALGQALAAASVPVVLTADQLATITPPAAITGFATEAKQLSDNHNVTVSNFPATQPVSGTFWQATQPVSAASLPLPTGAATAANQQTDALTNTELRAADVPITLDGEEVTANIKALGTVGSGQKTVTSAGTAEAIASSTAIESVTIKALADNTGNIYVGDSGVDSTNGFVLAAGETVSLDIDNLADVYIDAGTNDDGVSFIYLT
jgi:hypothetical protein